MDKPDDIVWLYKVYDTKEMSAKELQKELDFWTNHEMPHYLIAQDGKLIVRYQSGLLREGYFRHKLMMKLKADKIAESKNNTFKGGA